MPRSVRILDVPVAPGRRSCEIGGCRASRRELLQQCYGVDRCVVRESAHGSGSEAIVFEAARDRGAPLPVAQWREPDRAPLYVVRARRCLCGAQSGPGLPNQDTFCEGSTAPFATRAVSIGRPPMRADRGVRLGGSVRRSPECRPPDLGTVDPRDRP